MSRIADTFWLSSGCITCKKKRLKCDETKPTCIQCEKRNVECEGYKKDYKWRTFEETTQSSKAAKARKTSATALDSAFDAQKPSQLSIRSPISPDEQYSNWSPQLQDAFTTAAQALSGPASPPGVFASASPSRRYSASYNDAIHIQHPLPNLSNFNFRQHDQQTNQDGQNEQYSAGTNIVQSPTSHTSPNLADLLLPGTNMREPPDPSELRPPMSPHPYGSDYVEPTVRMNNFDEHEEEFDEEIMREPELPKSAVSNTRWSFIDTNPEFADTTAPAPVTADMSIIRPPELDPSSPEMLLLRYDKQTCGILSVKDGPTENPWRTLIWPLAKTSPALYHAVSSMAALHGSLSDPKLRISGMAHMNKSMKELISGLPQMSIDQALATSLALALGEGWDEKITTGIEHLRGAKAIVGKLLADRNAMTHVRRVPDENAKRIRFLCNTYVYLDVIARLTSKGEHAEVDFEGLLEAVNAPFDNGYIEIDPLMGCATTLFPMIGRVATLIQQARGMSRNSLHIVSEADTLREQLLQWQPPNLNMVERPQDPSSDARHAVQTALAYRLATLLYLHQAVPELPCESAHDLAKDVLSTLAVVPLHSRTVIVQIFPLLVGSCEMISVEDRHWVTQRWEGMMQRLSIVNVKSCWKIVQELWKRRDAYTSERARIQAARSFAQKPLQDTPFPLSLKRKTIADDSLDNDTELPSNGWNPQLSHMGDGRPLKRRFTFDPSSGESIDDKSGMHIVPLTRRHTDVTISSIEHEYTIRGDLHWLKLMDEWQWEGKFSPQV